MDLAINILKLTTSTANLVNSVAQASAGTAMGYKYSNRVLVHNTTEDDVKLKSYFLQSGQCLLPPSPVIRSMLVVEAMVFVDKGMRSATKGILQWQLPSCGSDGNLQPTFLFFAWATPLVGGNNFCALWINEVCTDNQPLDLSQDMNVSRDIYNGLLLRRLGILENGNYDFNGTSMAGSNYHLVQVGSKKRNEKIVTGYREPCHVENDRYEVKAIMGDTPHTTTIIEFTRK